MPLIHDLTKSRFFVVGALWERGENIFEGDTVLKFYFLDSLLNFKFGAAVILASEFKKFTIILLWFSMALTCKLAHLLT